MHAVSELEALRCLVGVRWALLESYALARQEALVEPVGVVLEPAHAYAAELATRLFLGRDLEPGAQRSVTCMERAALCSCLSAAAPDVVNALHAEADEPGRFCVVVLAQAGWVVTGTWQELFTLEAGEAERKPSRRRR